ncbi:MAG: VanZ family protein [Fimbriimonadaceae bacterium]|nr:VanZ family protein [Fimbriimonadaceae bacterium]
MLLVAAYSSSKGGADPMHKALMDWFGLTSQAADIATIAIRKTIHFAFYGVAGYLAFRYVIASRTVFSLNEKWKTNPPTIKLGLMLALPYVAILAAYDETRQLFSSNRSGSALDFLLDMAGALFFIWLFGTRYHAKVTNP